MSRITPSLVTLLLEPSEAPAKLRGLGDNILLRRDKDESSTRSKIFRSFPKEGGTAGIVRGLFPNPSGVAQWQSKRLLTARL